MAEPVQGAHKNRTEAAPDMLPILVNWQPQNEVDAYELSARSLETVTHLTEHEDEKANRISTAVAFLSAFSAVMFATIAEQYPWGRIVAMKGFAPGASHLFVVSYLIFAVYALLLVIGVMLALDAVRPRFNVPSRWTGKGPKSFLFFEKIAETAPKDWANAFIEQDKAGTLKRQYIHNNVFESYLIAEKIGWKVRKLKKAHNLYMASILLLAVWIVITAIGVAIAPARDGVKLDRDNWSQASKAAPIHQK